LEEHLRHIDRRSVAAPTVLSSIDAEVFRSEVDSFLRAGSREERPPRQPFPIINDSELRYALHRLFHDVCAYCETPLHGDGGIDLFRPYEGADDGAGSIDFRHYCWLGLDWANLYLACSNCLREKRNRFPATPRGTVGMSVPQLRRTERDTLLDPCADTPAQHLEIDRRGYLRPRSLRGEITIDILDLNRFELVDRRRVVLDRFLSADATLHERVEALMPGSPFAGSAWLLLLDHLPARLGRRRDRRRPHSPHALRRLIGSVFAPSRQDHDYDDGWQPVDEGKRRYVRRVTVRNFRGLAEAVLEFPERGREFSKAAGSVVVLGDNGAGKTSLLQAAALGALGPASAQDSGFTPDQCVTEGEYNGHVKVEFWGTRRTNLVTFEAGSPRFGGHAEVPVMVLGYGAYRLNARSELGEGATHYAFRVRSLFDERALVNGAFGLRQHLRTIDGRPDERRLEDATRAINAMLQDRARAMLGGDNRLIVDENGRAQRLDELSSGYKSVVALTTDIMDVMYEVWDGMTSGLAFILVDEIDAHLHPSWRLAIVEALRDTFPMAQFLMTTHDPLALRGLAEGEVVVLERGDGRATLSRPAVRGMDGMTVDQMLTSDLFGLSSTLDRAAAKQLERYYALLASPAISPMEEQALAIVEAALPPQVALGDTPRERLFYRVVDRYLARRGTAGVDSISDESLDELVQAFEQAEKEVISQDAEDRP
jgi:hypothetical protein